MRQRRRRFSAEVVMLCHGLLDVPGTFQVFGENHEVAGPESNGILAVRDCYLAFYQKAGFLFGVGPVEGAGVAFPYRPDLASFDFLLGRLSDNNISDSGHFVFLY